MIKYQQGDVLIRRLVDPIQEKAQNPDYNNDEIVSCVDNNSRWNQDDRTVIAEGEATGHAHAFNFENNPDVKITLFKQVSKRYDGDGFKIDNTFRPSTPRIMRIEGGDALLTHEEHNPIAIPPGEYVISQVREFDYMNYTTRRVVD